MNAKNSFQLSSHRGEFAKMTEQPAFRAALEAALLTFIEEQPTDLDVSKSWDCHAQAVGARRFVAILETLHLEPAPIKSRQLPHL